MAKQYSLDRALVTGVAWTAVARWTSQAFSWACMLYAVRVLAPGDFGLVAMATAATGLARMVEDIGLDSVIVQNQALTRDQIARLGGLACLAGVALALLFVGLAGPISSFYNEPVVATLIMLQCSLLCTDALQVVPRALLQRELRFKILAWITLFENFVAAAILAGLAYSGAGMLAIVANTVISGWLTTAVLYIVRPHPLAWPRAVADLMHSLEFGFSMLVSRFAYYGFSNADSWIIGRFLGKDSLGIYQFALTFGQLASREVTALFSKVLPGVLSTVQSDSSSLKRYFLVVTEAVAFASLPLCAGLMLNADDVVRIALGERWLAVTPVTQVLCGYMAAAALAMPISHVFIWTGHYRINLAFQLGSLAIVPACLGAGVVLGGLTGLSYGWVVATIAINLVALQFVFRIVRASWIEYFAAIRGAVIASAIMMAVITLTSEMSPAQPRIVHLALQVAIGAATYLAACLFLFAPRLKPIYAMVRGAPERAAAS